MPIVNRLQLRQSLGRDWLRDTLVGTTSAASAGLASGSYVMDASQADGSLDGQNLYQGATFRVNSQDRRIATFNTGSGAWLTVQSVTSTIALSGAYEIHERLSAEEKHRLLDRVISSIWQRREVALWGSADQAIYSLGPDVGHIFDVWSYGSPSDTADRDRTALDWWQVRNTATGRELNISPSIGGSAQLVVDAAMQLTLGSSDTATVNIPNLDWVCDGAAGLAYEMLARRAPGQEATIYKAEAARYAKRWTLGISRWLPPITGKRQLDYPY